MVTQTKSQELYRAKVYILSHSPFINWQIHSSLCFQVHQNSVTRPKIIDGPVEPVLKIVQAVLRIVPIVLGGLQNVSLFKF